MDYRRLNAASRTDAYPMPRIDDLVDQLGGVQFITTLDLSKGYWQVPVRGEDRHQDSLFDSRGLFQFRVMPFGLQGTPNHISANDGFPIAWTGNSYRCLLGRRGNLQSNLGATPTAPANSTHPTVGSQPYHQVQEVPVWYA